MAVRGSPPAPHLPMASPAGMAEAASDGRGATRPARPAATASMRHCRTEAGRSLASTQPRATSLGRALVSSRRTVAVGRQVRLGALTATPRCTAAWLHMHGRAEHLLSTNSLEAAQLGRKRPRERDPWRTGCTPPSASSQQSTKRSADHRGGRINAAHPTEPGAGPTLYQTPYGSMN